MSELYLILIPLFVPLVTHFIALQFPKRYLKWSAPITLMAIMVGFGIAIAQAVMAVASEEMSANDFYILVASATVVLLAIGISNRKKVVKSFRTTYYVHLGSYTYVFVVSGIMMYLLFPFMHFQA